jgi:hypothetical protein
LSPNIISELAPTGVLRADINLSNFLLVTKIDLKGDPLGLAVTLAENRTEVPLVNLLATMLSAMPTAADMPCCPKKAPTPDCAKDCPLMALCIVGSFLSLPANIVLPLPRMSASLPLAGNEQDAGLTHGPSPRPPKI